MSGRWWHLVADGGTWWQISGTSKLALWAYFSDDSVDFVALVRHLSGKLQKMAERAIVFLAGR
jgi:hypothetical protein